MPPPNRRVIAIALGVGVVAGLASIFGWRLWKADKFLGPAVFQGSPLPRPPGLAPEGQATWNGYLTFTNLDRKQVASLLPSGYVLAANSALPAEHPVALIFGDQTDGVNFLVPLAPGKPVPVTFTHRVHYSEVILGVPFVQKAGQPGWHTYIVRMYLDYGVAVIGGARYDYAKQFACLDWTGWEVEIWQQPVVCQPQPPPVLLQRKNLLSGDFRVTSGWRSGPDALANTKNFRQMVDIWTTKLLGRNAAKCSFFDWNLDDAQVARAATTYRFQSPFRPDLKTWPALGDLANVADGAVAVRGLYWGLGAPVPC